MDTVARYRGALLGLAAGDALGTTVEFRPPGTFEPVTDIVGGGPFRLEAGQWTDDTSMALCLAESLIERRGFDGHDQISRYVRWYREGHLASNGRCFDIGNTVRAALERFERTGETNAGSTDPRSAGNGSLMRLAPVPLFFSRDVEAAIARAADSSRTTHGVATAVDACRSCAALLVGAVDGRSKVELLDDSYWRWVDSTTRSQRSRPDRSSAVSRRRSAAAATSSTRSRRRCGRSIGATTSARSLATRWRSSQPLAGVATQIYLIPCRPVTRMTATEAARSFSDVLNRVAAGEEIEIQRNGAPVAVLTPPRRSRLVSAERFRELMASLPRVDDDFARDVRDARTSVGPPEPRWPS